MNPHEFIPRTRDDAAVDCVVSGELQSTLTTERPIVALVDVANVCPERGEQDHLDALILIGLMVRAACSDPGAKRQRVVEVDCRLYGGFRDVNGSPTERRSWLTRHLNELRGLQGGVRIVPTIAEHIVTAPDALLVGTYSNRGQKMVDAMVAEDLGAFSRSALYVDRPATVDGR